MRETRKLAEIRTDGGTQARAGLDEAKVAEYQERIEAGDRLPAMDVVYDGTSYWLWDGFHRHAAALRAGVEAFLVDVRQGTRRDAVRLACGANARHGLPRTPDDKRRAVQTMLEDEEWGKWSDRKIAEECVVSPTFVGKVRASLTVHVDSENQERTYVTRHGTPAVMNTGNIGRVGDPGPLAKMIEANVDPALYEAIHSLQHFVGTWIGKAHPGDLGKQAEILDHMKADKKHAYWTALSLDVARASKVFRKNDLVQALNNALDSLWQQLAWQSDKEIEALPGIDDLKFQVSRDDLAKIYALVSASDLTRDRARGVFEYDGSNWVVVGGSSLSCDAMMAVPRSEFSGIVLGYDGISRRIRRGGWFYYGQLIKCAGREYVLTVPRARFTPIPVAAAALHEDQPAVSEPDPPTEEHWAKSNPMSFWVEVDRLGVSRAKVLEFLQPGTKYASELNMTKEEAFTRLADAPRRIDPYNPAQHADGSPVLNEEQTEPEPAQPLPTPTPFPGYYALQSRINGMSLAIRKELKQEFRWSSDYEMGKFRGESGLKRLVTGARANVYDCLCDILLASIKCDEASEEAQ